MGFESCRGKRNCVETYNLFVEFSHFIVLPMIYVLHCVGQTRRKQTFLRFLGDFLNCFSRFSSNVVTQFYRV